MNSWRKDKMQTIYSEDKIETHQSCGILLKLIVELLKKKTPMNEKFIYISIDEIQEKIIKLQEESGYKIYQFYEINGENKSNVFLNDIQLFISQKDIYIKKSTPRITITSLGMLNASNIILPRQLEECLNSFLD